MKIKMSYLLLTFATVLAPIAQGQSTPPQPKITGVLTILTPRPGVTPEQVMKIMPAEIRATVPLYLDGKIQQWFTRGDGRGVIFLLNCKDVEEARALIESLPLSKENLMDEQFIPVGPLLPRGCFASAFTSCPGSSRWTWSRRYAPSLRCTASASSGSSLSFQGSSARICPPLASPRSPPTGTWQPGCSPSWRFSR